MKLNELRKLIRQEINEMIVVGGKPEKDNDVSAYQQLRKTAASIATKPTPGLSSEEAQQLVDFLKSIMNDSSAKEIAPVLKKTIAYYTQIVGKPKS